MLRSVIYIVMVMLAAEAGCAHAPVPMATTTGSNQQARAERILMQLAGGSANRFVVKVVEGDAYEAHGWRNGRITVGSTLAQSSTDAELAAVLAHEVGHMIADGRATASFDLNGCCRDADAEVRADRIGTRLLSAAHLPAEAMVTMLTRLRSVQPPNSICYREMSRRIAALEVDRAAGSASSGAGG